jgi:hypothetical protein
LARAESWARLNRLRFPELPYDCGNAIDPGLIDSDHMRDWSRRPTTPDQYRIEAYLDRFDLRSKRILHIGVGNSGLAQRLHRRVKEIVGTTVDEAELEHARALGLPNYAVKLHNKYADGGEAVNGEFDFIVDNNPVSACCCITHLAAVLDLFAAKLAEGGQVVTDRHGLHWIAPGVHPRFRFDFDDLAATAALAGLAAWRIDGNVHVLTRNGLPLKPKLVSRLRSFVRRARALPGRVLRAAPRRAGRLWRRVIGRPAEPPAS